MPEATAALPRDVRTDRIGFGNELQTQHVNNLKTDLKVRMTNEEITRVTADFFEGLLVTGFTTTVDPADLLKLYEKGGISRAQFLSALSVKKEPLEAFLSGDAIRKLGDTKPSNPQLRITRIKGVESALVGALKAVADSFYSAVPSAAH